MSDWVSVAEVDQLPGACHEVLASDGKYVVTGWISGGGLWKYGGGCLGSLALIPPPTHWMELPAAPVAPPVEVPLAANECCGNCRYSKPHYLPDLYGDCGGEVKGFIWCRRNAPGKLCFPGMHESDWCGDWAAKGDAPAPDAFRERFLALTEAYCGSPCHGDVDAYRQKVEYTESCLVLAREMKGMA